MHITWNGKPLASLKEDELISYIADQESKNSILLQNMANELLSLKGEIAALSDTSHIQNGLPNRLVEIERRISLQEQCKIMNWKVPFLRYLNVPV